MGDLKSKLYSCFPYYIQNTLCSLQGYIRDSREIAKNS